MRSEYYVKGEPQGYYDMLEQLCNDGKLKLVKKYTFFRGMEEEENKAKEKLFAK